MNAAAVLPVLLVGPFGATELLIILGIVILIFGAAKLPQLGAGLGEGIRNFRKSMKSIGNPPPGDSGKTGRPGDTGNSPTNAPAND